MQNWPRKVDYQKKIFLQHTAAYSWHKVGSGDPQRWNQLKLRMKSEGWNLADIAYDMHYFKSRMKYIIYVTSGYDGQWLDQAVMKNLTYFSKKKPIFEGIFWWDGRLEALDEDISWSYHIFYESPFFALFAHRNLKFEGLADFSRPIGSILLTSLMYFLGKNLSDKNFQFISR